MTMSSRSSEMSATVPARDFGSLSDAKFAKFAAFVTDKLGIKMPDKKKQMLQGRLQRRVRELGLRSFDDYYRYVFHEGGLKDELQSFINAVTTNKTEFFREAGHFDYLTATALPTIAADPSLKLNEGLRLWCAGCSTGEEPYTLAMVLAEHAERHPGFRYGILATDVSTKVLDFAKTAVYDANKVEKVSLEMKRKHLLKSKDARKPRVRVVPALRSRVTFRSLNFMNESYDVPSGFQVIFFRNVMIYFDRVTQEAVINRMADKMTRGGYLFTGHAESLRDLDIPFEMVANSVYRRV